MFQFVLATPFVIELQKSPSTMLLSVLDCFVKTSYEEDPVDLYHLRILNASITA